MSRADSLDVEWYESQTAHRSDDPQLTVYTNLNGYINAAADREWFADFDAMDIGFVVDEGLLVFRPDDDGRYSLSREANKGQGADVHVTSAIKHAWGDPGLKDTQKVPMREAGGHIVADLSELVFDDTADHRVQEAVQTATADPVDTAGEDHEDTAAEESELPGGELSEYHTNAPLVEEYLVHAVRQGDRELASADIVEAVDGDLDGRAVGGALRQLKTADDAPVHVSKSEEQDDGRAVWHVEPEVDLFDHNDDAADDVAATLQAADDVESVQALADALGVSTGQARARARDAGVYGDLQDRVQRPGVER